MLVGLTRLCLLVFAKFVQSLDFQLEGGQGIGGSIWPACKRPICVSFAQVRINMNLFRTRDFSLAAFLITLGFPLKETKSVGTSLLFCFPPDAADATPLYIQGERVSARAFYSAIKDLKSLIHNSREARINRQETNENRL